VYFKSLTGLVAHSCHNLDPHLLCSHYLYTYCLKRVMAGQRRCKRGSSHDEIDKKKAKVVVSFTFLDRITNFF